MSIHTTSVFFQVTYAQRLLLTLTGWHHFSRYNSMFVLTFSDMICLFGTFLPNNSKDEHAFYLLFVCFDFLVTAGFNAVSTLLLMYNSLLTHVPGFPNQPQTTWPVGNWAPTHDLLTDSPTLYPLCNSADGLVFRAII